MVNPLLFAFLTPLFFALDNVLGKYVISRHVRQPIGFAVVAALPTIAFALLLAVFLD